MTFNSTVRPAPITAPAMTQVEVFGEIGRAHV